MDEILTLIASVRIAASERPKPCCQLGFPDKDKDSCHIFDSCNLVMRCDVAQNVNVTDMPEAAAMEPSGGQENHKW